MLRQEPGTVATGRIGVCRPRLRHTSHGLPAAKRVRALQVDAAEAAARAAAAEAAAEAARAADVRTQAEAAQKAVEARHQVLAEREAAVDGEQQRMADQLGGVNQQLDDARSLADREVRPRLGTQHGAVAPRALHVPGVARPTGFPVQHALALVGVHDCRGSFDHIPCMARAAAVLGIRCEA